MFLTRKEKARLKLECFKEVVKAYPDLPNDLIFKESVYLYKWLVSED